MEGDHLEGLRLDVKIILKPILKKYEMKLWAEFFCLIIWISCRLFNTIISIVS
jgi:hypothetical protein